MKTNIAAFILAGFVLSAPLMAEEMKTDMPKEQMMQQCHGMMAEKQKMMTEMKAQDDQLSAQVAEMNSAPADKKLDLMAAVLTRMVEQRAAMNVRKTNMDDEMKKHMMLHMPMGKESMAQCPMMKGMDEKQGDTYKEQQQEQN